MLTIFENFFKIKWTSRTRVLS